MSFGMKITTSLIDKRVPGCLGYSCNPPGTGDGSYLAWLTVIGLHYGELSMAGNVVVAGSW